MRCRRARRQLCADRYGKPMSEAAKEHVAACERCQAFATESKQLDRLLQIDQLAPGESLVTADFDERFFARLEQKKQRPRPVHPNRVPWLLGGLGLATAAALGLFVVLGTPPTPREPLTEHEAMLAYHFDLLQEDVDMLHRLEEVETFELLAQLDPQELEALDAAEEAPQ